MEHPRIVPSGSGGMPHLSVLFLSPLVDDARLQELPLAIVPIVDFD